MKVTRLERKVLSVARRDTPSEAVPYAFEQRVLAKIREQGLKPVDALVVWGRALWRGAVSSVAVMALVIALGSIISVPAPPVDTPALAMDLEDAVLAPVTFNSVSQNW